MISRQFLPVVSFLFLLAVASSVCSQEIDWLDPNGGDYDDPNNWAGANVPDLASETAQFDLNSTYDVLFGGGLSTLVDDLIVRDGVVTFETAPGSLADATYLVNDDLRLEGGELLLADGASMFDVNLDVNSSLQMRFGSNLLVESGASVTADAAFIALSADDATAIFDGLGTSFTINNQGLGLGAAGGTGTLTFQNGAAGNITGQTDLVANSSFQNSTGRLNVLSGSSLQTENIFVGNSDSAGALQEATLTVSGTDSTLSMTGSSTLTIGDETNPEVTSDVVLSAGGTLTSGAGAILLQNTGTLTIANGTFNANGPLTMTTGTALTLNGGELNTAAGLDAGGTITQSGGTYNSNGDTLIDGGSYIRSSGVFNIAPTMGLTLQNGGVFEWGGNSSDLLLDDTGSSVLVTGGGSTFRQVDSSGDSTVFVNNGVSLSASLGGTIEAEYLHVEDGSVTIDGAGSTLDVTSGNTSGFLHQVGVNGNATLTLSNGATSTFESALATKMEVGVVSGTGTINLNTGAALTLQSLDLDETGTAIINVDGVGTTLTQVGNSILEVGSSSGSTGTINVQNNGEFNTGTGATVVNATGTINVGVTGSGTFTANGDVNVNGGTINRGDTSNFFLPFGHTLTATDDAQISFTGDYNLSRTFNIQSGSDFTTTGELTIGFFDLGTLNVDGIGSRVVAGNVDLSSGSFGTANLTFSNGATGEIGEISLAIIGLPGNTGNFSVLSDADVNIGNLTIVGSGGPLTSGTVTVDGAGSTLTQNGSSNLSVGSNSGNDIGTINIQNAGVYTTGTGSIDINQTGTVNIKSLGTFNTLANFNLLGTINLDGGILSAIDPNFASGTFNYLSGTLELNSNQWLDTARLEELQVNPLPTNRILRINGSATIAGGTSLQIDGGMVESSGLALLPGSSLKSLLASTVSGTLLASPATTIDATNGDMTIGSASAVNGFASAGTMLVGNSTVTLLDSNDAVFDSLALVTLGDGQGGSGSLVADNGITLDFGGNISGFGMIDTPNDAATPLVNNGNITGDDPNSPITLTGYVKGVGTCDNCNITGTDAPGFSTAAVNRGSISYNGTLEIELGGTSPGSGFDQLNHILGAGLADLGGTLDVSFLGGFIPSAGDTFEIITATSVLDTFETVNLPSLPGDLLWFINYGATSVELVSTYGADFDEDGDVDDDDLIAWQGGFGGAPATHMTGDANTDAFANGFDFLTWQRQFGNGSGVPVSAGAATIPEPPSLLLAAVGLLKLSSRRKRGYRIDSRGNAAPDSRATGLIL